MRTLLAELAAFRDDRNWQRFHTPRNLAEALNVEAGELLECFLWDGAFEVRSDPERELADVLIYALNLCLALGVDPETIVREKMASNAQKYPIPQAGLFNGS